MYIQTLNFNILQRTFKRVYLYKLKVQILRFLKGRIKTKRKLKNTSQKDVRQKVSNTNG